MSISLQRGPLETIQLEQVSGIDGQGKPSYKGPVDLQAKVVRRAEVVNLPNGQVVRSVAMVWIDGCQEPLPNTDDRITAQGLVGIVMELKDGRGVQAGQLDHIRVMLKEP